MSNTTESQFESTSNTRSYSPPFDETGIIISAVILITFMAIGLIGNGLTIVVIKSYKQLNQNSFINFILSLCVSDLISALISWLFLYRRTWGFDVWAPIPDIFCKFYWSADIMTSYVTGAHILSFAVLRFIAIKFPQTFKQISLRHARVWMCIIWLVSFIFGFIPCWIIFGATEHDRNSNDPDAGWPACTVLLEQLKFYDLYHKTAFPIFIYVPILGVFITSIIIIGIVYTRSKNPMNNGQSKTKKEKQAVWQLGLIALSFLVGYVPFTAYEFWSMQPFTFAPQYQVSAYWFGMIEYFFLRFSECLNPVFYNIGSAKVRFYTKKFLKEKCLCNINFQVRPTNVSVTSSNISTVTKQ